MNESFYQLRLEQIGLSLPISRHYLLQDISLEVREGECLGIVGASGAGKTTLLRILNRLVTPTHGKLYLENRDYKKINPLELRSEVVLVLQEPKLLGRSVRESLIYPLKFQRLPASMITERLEEGLNRLNIPRDWLERTEVQLSLGQRQLVSIARAVMMKPKILLLDEPTSALDAGKSGYLISYLKEISQEKTTIIMVNHQLEIAEQFSQRVIHLREGMLVYNGEAKSTNWTRLRQELIQEESRSREEWNI